MWWIVADGLQIVRHSSRRSAVRALALPQVLQVATQLRMWGGGFSEGEHEEGVGEATYYDLLSKDEDIVKVGQRGPRGRLCLLTPGASGQLWAQLAWHRSGMHWQQVPGWGSVQALASLPSKQVVLLLTGSIEGMKQQTTEYLSEGSMVPFKWAASLQHRVPLQHRRLLCQWSTCRTLPPCPAPPHLQRPSPSTSGCGRATCRRSTPPVWPRRPRWKTARAS